MKIILEAEVMENQRSPVHTPPYMPGHCAIRLRVLLVQGATRQEFNQDVILRLDDVQSVFDHLMKNLTRNMRDVLISYLEDGESWRSFRSAMMGLPRVRDLWTDPPK